MKLADITAQDWDVIVVGTGIGGGTIGRRLAEAGMKVLFLERGPKGAAGERQSILSPETDPHARHVRGFWPTQLQATINGRDSRFFGPIGAGVGGSSVFYAATLERPEKHDLDEVDGVAHPTNGWCIGYDAFAPYFDEAERLFHVHGEEDPLGSTASNALMAPPPFGAGDTALVEDMRRVGLHPYYAHTAVKRVPGCETCLGTKCPRRCKMDGRSAGVLPALETGNAALLTDCKVLGFKRRGRKVTAVDAELEGRKVTFKAPIVVLAAGALTSPQLLLASKSAKDPNGLGNNEGLVGRNLMFHLTEMFAIWPRRDVPDDGPSKSIAFRDHYLVNGQRLGMVQAMGLEASRGELTHHLNQMFDRSMFRHVKVLRHLTRIPAYLVDRLFGRAKLFAGILEDFPRPENRVIESNDPDILGFTYDFPDDLMQRRKLFRRRIRKSLRGMRMMFLTYQPELNFGHPCGTLTFGSDPKSSVLDPSCRVHGLQNFFVTDASFMPTSFGANPSLTIAANALRVADLIIESEKDK